MLLVAYAVFTAGAWYYLCVRGPRSGQRANQYDFVVPVLGLIVLGYTLYRNVLPSQATLAGRVIAIMALIWVIAAIIAIVVAPGWAARIGERLANDEGLALGVGKIAQTAAELEEASPMPVTIDDAWTYHGLTVVRLENEFLALDVLPERGREYLPPDRQAA